MSSLDGHDSRNRYWRSLADLNDTAEFRKFLEAEFPAETESGGMTRRRWLRLMGASLALAGASGCRWEKAEILPFAERPPGRTPGKPQRFATAMDLAGSAVGLLVTCVDGRPIKIEGNPKHPASLGATDAIAQAAILQLYDPDRSRDFIEKTRGDGTVRSWADFTRFARPHFDQLRKTGGAGLRVLAEASSSLTLQRLRGKLLKTFPQSKWHEYEPISPDNEWAERIPFRVLLHLDRAKVIVCLDADPLGSHPAAVQYAADFAKGREVTDGKMNRLYAIESCLSLTGAAADHRLAVPSRDVGAFARALEHQVRGMLSSEAFYPCRHPLVWAMAWDLAVNRSQSVVVCGPRQPAEVHEVVQRINVALENVGKTVTYITDPEWGRSSHVQAIRSLAADVADQKVRTLLILGGNPVYNAPADLDFAQAIEGVDTSIHLGLYRNETSRLCTWHLPRAHFLEAWGDARAYDPTYHGVVQPVIAPLFQGKSCVEVLAEVLDETSTDAYDLVRETFREALVYDDWEKGWRETLHDGLPREFPVLDLDFVPDLELRRSRSTGAGPPSGAPELPEAKIENGELEIVFRQDPSVYDGRFANNGWLQEWPDPITRLTWGNAAVMSPATAEKLGVEDQTLVRLKYKGRELEIPAYVMPGQADGSVAVSLGYGRTAAGEVGGLAHEGVEPVGANAYKLRTSDAMHFGTGLTVEPTGERFPLAGVQDHFAIDAAGHKARAERVDTLIREATLEHYGRYPHFAKHTVHHPPLESLWKEHEYEGYQWGMTIDLSRCTGCGACVVACQAENNVPIVGRQRVLEGREMQWIRVDRYFRGDPAQPQVSVQPVTCQHCELAPCEQVCPVAATVHDRQGLNVMVYNRCVGTRYCANNCPYKVRRFNFFNYHKDLAEPENETAKMLYNPEVTIRSRGVMEKCTYCLQRIRAAAIDAKGSRRRIKDGEVKTACQQVCPTRAIVFGDLSDPQSQVARRAADDRSYTILAQLNVKPRTRYLARIRNPNPELPKPPT